MAATITGSEGHLTMTRHFGVLIPSTNTTVEMECRLLPATYQAHVGRLMSSGAGSFSPSRDEDIDYQSRLLGTAKVEMVILAQTSASLFAEDYDDVVTKRMSAGAPYSEAVRMRSESSARGTRAMHSPGSIGPRSRSSWCPAAISRRWRRLPPGSENSASR